MTPIREAYLAYRQYCAEHRVTPKAYAVWLDEVTTVVGAANRGLAS